MTTPRWYMVNKMGMATLCASKADAEKEAADAQRFWPHMGPHRAVQLVEAASVAASAGSEPVATVFTMDAQAIPGVQWQCGPQASGFTAHQADSQPARDERDDFEKTFPLPSGCIRVGTGYASTDYSNWAAHTHVERWKGWRARAARAPADSVTAPGGPTDAQIDACARSMLSQPWGIGSRIEDARAFAKRILSKFAPPAQAADSVLEDAARLDWLALAGPVSICVVIDMPHDGEVEVATDDVTGYGQTLREALDAARKQGANHD